MQSREMWKCFRALDLDAFSLGLDEAGEPYFCTPVGAEILGNLGVDGIHFVLLAGTERVYCVSPMAMEVGKYVLPVADDAAEFLAFVLFCRDASPLEQLWRMDAARFYRLLEEDTERHWEDEEFFARKAAAIAAIEEKLQLSPQDPFEKVKELQACFDAGSLSFPDEYYEVLGIEPVHVI